MNKSLFVFVAILATVFAADLNITGYFTGQDSYSSTNAATFAASVTVNSVSFTIAADPTITISYPGSGSSGTVGSISSGASGYGNFQVVSPWGTHTLTFIVKYKKTSTGNTWQYYNQTLPLYIEGGDSTTYSKKTNVEKDEEVVVQSANGNADFTIQPEYWVAEESQPTWQSIQITSNGPALASVSYTIITDGNMGIYYHSGNVIGNIDASGSGRSNFQMTGTFAGNNYVTVRINYRKSGVPKTHSETMLVRIGSGDETTYSKRVVQPKASLPTEMNNVTVIGLAIGGIALIAIVAVVVVVAVVKRQRSNIVA